MDKSVVKLMQSFLGKDDRMTIKVGQSKSLFNYLAQPAMRHDKLHSPLTWNVLETNSNIRRQSLMAVFRKSPG
jgi:hypothetical protein